MADSAHRNEDRQPGLVLSVLLLLFLFTYLTTDWMVRYPFPPLVDGLQYLLELKFVSLLDGPHLNNDLWLCWFVPSANAGFEVQRRALFATIALGFLTSYFLPRAWTRPAVVLCTIGGLLRVLGWLSCSQMLLGLGIVYLAFHRPLPLSRSCVAFFALAFAVFCTTGSLQTGTTRWVFFLLALVGFPLYHWLHSVNQEKFWSVARTLSVHACWLALGITLLSQPWGDKIVLPAGLVLSFFLWERLVFYSIDYRDDAVPRDLSWINFWATLLSPATLVNMGWLNRIGKGYSYLEETYLARPRNDIVWSGVRLMSVALLFLLTKYPVLHGIRLAFTALGAEPLTLTEVADRFAGGLRPSMGSIWSALLVDFFSFYLTWSVVAHFKVAAWRLMGYDLAPYFQYPFLSTNIVEMWRRYSFYYREFLLAAFYYPTFLALRGYSRTFRTVLATLAAATYGNFLYHLLEALLLSNGELATLQELFRTLPYFVLFGLAIATTSLVLSKQKRRPLPWRTFRRLPLDLVGVLLTFGFYILLRVLNHVPQEHSFETTAKIILGAFGF